MTLYQENVELWLIAWGLRFLFGEFKNRRVFHVMWINVNLVRQNILLIRTNNSHVFSVNGFEPSYHEILDYCTITATVKPTYCHWPLSMPCIIIAVGFIVRLDWAFCLLNNGLVVRKGSAFIMYLILDMIWMKSDFGMQLKSICLCLWA